MLCQQSFRQLVKLIAFLLQWSSHFLLLSFNIDSDNTEHSSFENENIGNHVIFSFVMNSSKLYINLLCIIGPSSLGEKGYNEIITGCLSISNHVFNETTLRIFFEISHKVWESHLAVTKPDFLKNIILWG